jgi:hypothetical protein
MHVCLDIFLKTNKDILVVAGAAIIEIYVPLQVMLPGAMPGIE